MNIIFDWGGTIVRDKKIYNSLVNQAICGPFKNQDSWGDRIVMRNMKDRMIEYLDKSVEFQYDGSVKTISEYCSNKSKDRSFVLFDNKPCFDIKQGDVLKEVRDTFFRRMDGRANGFYVETDKIKMAKIVGADIFIEDDPRIALTLANINVKTILVLRDSNKFFNKDIMESVVASEKYFRICRNFRFAEDWTEVKEIIEEIRPIVERFHINE